MVPGRLVLGEGNALTLDRVADDGGRLGIRQRLGENVAQRFHVVAA